ncbi:hypothetical protein [Geodermatophilus nigrescens]|uniref:Uncharacterized protein n=1 Tax=Geodermatophilus nigrescens TaxID=1070870 RepID=A0A1M5G511_9ACTN|nr:hypothetical protein [Geodermatophilus nigrescens]SHF98823.1 hypothetical protein SAMN05444351_1551 [Geodermatophilus nigrescens]
MERIPDSLPVLGRGRHRTPARGACFLEYTALLAGEAFTDAPRCVDAELAAVLRHANDVLSDADRPRLLPLLGRAIGLVAPGPATGRLQRRVAQDLAAAVGSPLSAEELRWVRAGAVDRLFWSLMFEPVPVSTSPAWVARLVERLDLLHGCFEAALAVPARSRV